MLVLLNTFQSKWLNMVCFNFDISSPCLKSKEEDEGSVATPSLVGQFLKLRAKCFTMLTSASTKSDITIMLTGYLSTDELPSYL